MTKVPRALAASNRDELSGHPQTGTLGKGPPGQHYAAQITGADRGGQGPITHDGPTMDQRIGMVCQFE